MNATLTGVWRADSFGRHARNSALDVASCGEGECIGVRSRKSVSDAGQAAMQEARLTRNHKELLLYFRSLILDPEGHRQWAESVRAKLTRISHQVAC